MYIKFIKKLYIYLKKGGLRYVNGFDDRPSVRPNLSMGDTLAGIHGALGTIMALYAREGKNKVKGQVVDAAIYESVFSIMEGNLYIMLLI